MFFKVTSLLMPTGSSDIYCSSRNLPLTFVMLSNLKTMLLTLCSKPQDLAAAQRVDPELILLLVGTAFLVLSEI